jgi:uncharacterized protein
VSVPSSTPPPASTPPASTSPTPTSIPPTSTGAAPSTEARSTRSWPARLAQEVVLAPITIYRVVISPAIPRRCKYEPTCSRYAVDAIRKYGILRGLVLGVWRLLRCNPWSHGGYDPVEAQRVFAVDHAAHGRP